MVCVQQMMGNIAEGLFQVIAVQLPHVRVLMGEPAGGGLIDAPQDAAAFFRQHHAVMDRLTAAADSASSAAGSSSSRSREKRSTNSNARVSSANTELS